MSEHPLLYQYVSPLYFTSSTPSNNSDNVNHRDPLSRNSRSIENIGGSRNNHGPSLEEICIVNTPLSPSPRKVSVDESNFDDKEVVECSSSSITFNVNLMVVAPWLERSSCSSKSVDIVIISSSS
ncbi:7422_t:CDS:2, partial [Entrophospora sp. SA101]